MKTWKTISPELVLATLERIHYSLGAGGLYRPSDFPSEVQDLVRNEFRREFSDEFCDKDDLTERIWLNGIESKAYKAIDGLYLAELIAKALGVEYEATGGIQELANIKEAIAAHFSGCGAC